MHRGHGQSINRRTFLKIGSLGAAFTATGLGLAADQGTQPAPAAKPDAVTPVYRTLGRTGMKVTVIGIGALATAEAAIFRAAFERGINFIDTARAYLEGRSEKLVAEALQGYRNKVYLATKVKPGSKEAMLNSIKESLDSLKVDHVDLLQLHNITTKEEVYSKDYREVLADARNEGKARFIGVTAHAGEAEVVNAVVDDPEKLYDTVLVTYNYKSDPKVKEAIARAAQAGIGIIAMKTQQGGYKTKELGDISPHQAALKWVLQDTNVALAAPGMLDLNQLTENIAVMGMKFTQADAEILERYAQAIAPYYCRRCGACRGTCPARVYIPKVNRCLMYAEGYGDLALARATYKEIPAEISVLACRDCARCVARCAHGINIGERMARARELLT